VQLARQRPGIVIASIFVNQLQFAPHEDFATYPRTLERDIQLLSAGGCDIGFAPGAKEMYPEEQTCKVHPPASLADVLEGEFRPGFFIGVGTIVLKLFSVVQPSVAVFGKKDYQQHLVIKDMTRQFALPIEIIAGETVRESSGLALSSRNGYLSDAQRTEAARLSGLLRTIVHGIRAGRRDWRPMEQAAADELISRGWRPDYVAIRRQADLGAPSADQPLVALAAARLGDTRLIDSLEI